MGGYTLAFRDSLVITFATVVGVVSISTLGAYSLARLRVRGADALMMYLIVVLPIVALFLLMQERFIQGMAAGGMKG